MDNNFDRNNDFIEIKQNYTNEDEKRKKDENERNKTDSYYTTFKKNSLNENINKTTDSNENNSVEKSDKKLNNNFIGDYSEKIKQENLSEITSIFNNEVKDKGNNKKNKGNKEDTKIKDIILKCMNLTKNLNTSSNEEKTVILKDNKQFELSDENQGNISTKKENENPGSKIIESNIVPVNTKIEEKEDKYFFNSSDDVSNIINKNQNIIQEKIKMERKTLFGDIFVNYKETNLNELFLNLKKSNFFFNIGNNENEGLLECNNNKVKKIFKSKIERKDINDKDEFLYNNKDINPKETGHFLKNEKSEKYIYFEIIYKPKKKFKKKNISKKN